MAAEKVDWIPTSERVSYTMTDIIDHYFLTSKQNENPPPTMLVYRSLLWLIDGWAIPPH